MGIAALYDIHGNLPALEAVLQEGAERARVLAEETMVEVRRAMGVGPPG